MPISQLHSVLGDLHKSMFILRHLFLAVNVRISKIAIVEILYHLLEVVIDFSDQTRWL